jgi:hypothetical protein
MPETPESMTLGVQPLDALMTTHELNNHALVAADVTKGVTHKVVNKARKGRRLTARMQKKLVAALNVCLVAKELPKLKHADLFNYVGP